ncbi:SigE family RNA polymerase sigma factor [Catellatospora tritici]|uniref:SigE family RNA polymerase sigma factor n=1 Tax=Catellatospora tritici TaxID=2851566 RepID=UPI0027E08B52|nr:SigE family RNA polymerase sigma factor [Catellatospora tritici]
MTVTYEEFATTRLAALSRYAVMLTGDQHLAQDLVQETMVRAQLHWRKVSRAESPERYVKRMMINQYLDWRRGSWFRRVFLRADPDETVAVPHDLAERSAQRDVIWSVLATLPRQQRAALVLRYYEDLADAEIADMLGCTVGTARGYISKALTRLRESAGAQLSMGVVR